MTLTTMMMMTTLSKDVTDKRDVLEDDWAQIAVFYVTLKLF